MGVVTGGGSGGGGGAISGVTVTGTAAASQVPVASSASAGAWTYPPGFEIGYDQITGNVTVSSTTESAGTTIITCAAHTFDGAAVLVQAYFNVEPGSASGLTLCLFEGATEITRLIEFIPATNSLGAHLTGLFRFTPTAAAHTYTVTGFHVGVNSGTIVAGAGGTGTQPPCFIRFVKV